MGWLGLGWQPTARSKGASADGTGWRRSVDSGELAARGGGETDQEQIGVEGCPILGLEGGVLTGVGLLTTSAVGRVSSTATAWSVGRWRLLTSRRGAVRRWGPHGVVAGLEEDRR
jgi:hypothetical protein